MLNEVCIDGRQHCNIKKKSDGKSESSVVREYLFAIVDIIAVSNIIATIFIAIAQFELYHSCDICIGTNPSKFVVWGVIYIEAMTINAIATNTHII